MSTGNETFDPYAQWLGLNLQEQPLDHYMLLGLPRYESDPALIEQQADERMRLVRSFQTGPRGRFTQKLMNELAAAKLCLLSPSAKRAYDQQLELWSLETEPRPAGDQSESDEVFAAELPPAAVDAAVPPPVVAAPLALRLPPAAPPIARAISDAAEDEEPIDNEETGPASMSMVVVGLVLGLMGIGIAVWMLSSFAMHRGWLAGGPPSGGPPAALVGKTATQQSSPSRINAPVPASERLAPEASDDEAIEVLQEGSGDVVLSPVTAAVVGDIAIDLEGTADVLTGWSSANDAAAWRFRLVQPGFFEAQITYAAGQAAFGRKIQLTIDGRAKTLELQPTSEGYRTDVLTIAVPQTGPHELRMAPASNFDGELRVKLIRLKAIATSGP